MDLDIIIYAVIAVLLFAKLWSVFGRRNEGDQGRPNPLVGAPRKINKDDDVPFGTNPETLPEAPMLLRTFRSAPASLAGGLEQIKAHDFRFDERQFLQGSRAAFQLIVEEFAKGDLTSSTRLLGPKVLARFKDALEQRRKASEVMEGKIVRIKDVETAAVRIENTTASIIVKFVSEQINVLRDLHGKIIAGAEGRVEEITDLWTFSRDLSSDDPNWVLVETKN